MKSRTFDRPANHTNVRESNHLTIDREDRGMQPLIGPKPCGDRRHVALAVFGGCPLLMAATSVAVVVLAENVDLPWSIVVEARACALAFNLIVSIVGAAAGGFFLRDRMMGRIACLIAGGAYGLIVYIMTMMLIMRFVL